MSIHEQVHWHEGLFLQPHHLQTMQVSMQSQMVGERKQGWPHPYGLVNARLSTDALDNMLVKFDKLHVVMPSGLVVRVPENADLPALDIKAAFEASTNPFTICLGVPLWQSARANTIDSSRHDDWRVTRIWRVSEIQRSDENTGESSQPMLVKRVNARLMLSTDDQTDMEVLPLVRIAHRAGEGVGLPCEDPAFVPACMVLSGWPKLRDLVRDLVNQVEASRRELVMQMTRGGTFDMQNLKGRQMEQVWRLRTLNRFAAVLPHLVREPAVGCLSPFQMYLHLRELLGELAALYPAKDPFEISAYDHDNPKVAFEELSQKIRPLLKGMVQDTSMKVEFERQPGRLAAQLEERHLTQPSEYYLGIQTKQDSRALAELVENADQFKVMPLSLITKLVFGIPMEEERHHPVELPTISGLYYFRLRRDKNQDMWKRIVQERAIGIRWPNLDATDYKMTLYMTVAGGGEG